MGDSYHVKPSEDSIPLSISKGWPRDQTLEFLREAFRSRALSAEYNFVWTSADGQHSPTIVPEQLALLSSEMGTNTATRTGYLEVVFSAIDGDSTLTSLILAGSPTPRSEILLHLKSDCSLPTPSHPMARLERHMTNEPVC